MKTDLLETIDWLKRNGLSGDSNEMTLDRIKAAIEIQRNELLDIQNDKLQDIRDQINYLAARTH